MPFEIQIAVAKTHKYASRDSGDTVELKSARNYACDGCYETLFPGETEFSFFYIPAVDVLEKALNSGAGFNASGGSSLRGTKTSYRTPPANLIRDFEHLYEILELHIKLNVHRQLATSVSQPPSVGPSTGPTITPRPQIAIALPRSSIG